MGERKLRLGHVMKCTQATLSDHILSNLDIEREHFHLHKLPSLMDRKFSYSTFGCGSTCLFDAISYLKHFFSFFLRLQCCKSSVFMSFSALTFFPRVLVLFHTAFMKFAAGLSPICVDFPSHARQFCAKTFPPARKKCLQCYIVVENRKSLPFLLIPLTFQLSSFRIGQIYLLSHIADISGSPVTLSGSMLLSLLFIKDNIICDGKTVMTT